MELTDIPIPYMLAGLLVWLVSAIFLIKNQEWAGAAITAVIFFMPSLVELALQGRTIPTGQLILIFFGPILLVSLLYKKSRLDAVDVGLLIGYALCIIFSIYWNGLPFWSFKASMLPPVFALLIYLSVSSIRSVHRILLVFGVFVFVNSVIAGLQWSGHNWAYLPSQLAKAEAGGFRRGFGLTDHFSQAGLYAAMVLPIAAIGYFSNKRKILKAIFFLFGLSAIAGLAFTVLRAGLIGGVLGVIVSTLLWNARKGFPQLVIAGLIVSLLILITPFMYKASDAIIRHTEVVDESAKARPELARMGINAWLRSPVFGGGPDAVDRHEGRVTDPHNTYVNVLAETGVIGLFLFSAIFWRAFHNLAKLRKRGYNRERAALTGALLSGLIVALFHSINYILLAWLIPGLCLAVARLAERHADEGDILRQRARENKMVARSSR